MLLKNLFSSILIDNIDYSFASILNEDLDDPNRDLLGRVLTIWGFAYKKRHKNKLTAPKLGSYVSKLLCRSNGASNFFSLLIEYWVDDIEQIQRNELHGFNYYNYHFSFNPKPMYLSQIYNLIYP